MKYELTWVFEIDTGGCMKSSTAMAACSALALCIAIQACAQSYGTTLVGHPGAAPDRSAEQHGSPVTTGVTTGGTTGATTEGTSSDAAQVMGEHNMTVQVTKLNSATGKVSLSSAAGPLDLHFPPESLSNMKIGDSLILRLGFVQGPSGTAPPGGLHSEGVQLRGEHRMTGHVTVADHGTGKVSVTTAEGPLDLHFPPRAVSILKQGDPITVYLAFTQGGGRGEALSRSRDDKHERQ